MTTTGTIKAKGLANTGITEQHLARIQLGDTVLAVVELVADAYTETRDGDDKVAFNVLTIEPAPNQATIDHLRNLTRSFFYERQLADGQLQIDTGDDIEPKVADVLAAGRQHEPHPYLTSQLAVDDNPVCDICGQVEDTPVHQATKHTVTDPFQVPDDEPDDEQPDLDYGDDEGPDDDGDEAA